METTSTRRPGSVPKDLSTAGMLTLRDGFGLDASTATAASQLHFKSQPAGYHSLLQALEGAPRQGHARAYAGEVGHSLLQLRSEMAAHHAQLCWALGEPGNAHIPTFHMLSGPSSSSQLVHQSNALLTDASSPGDVIRASVTPVYGYPRSWRENHRTLHGQQSTAPTWLCSTLAWNTPVTQAISDIMPAGSRTSPFITSQAKVSDDTLQAQSQFVYPPAGSTFEGYRSKQTDALGRGKDKLSDWHYRRAPGMLQIGSPAHYIEPGPAVRRLAQPAADQLDTFLADWLRGGSKQSLPAYHKQDSVQSRDLEYRLARFVAGSH